MGLVCVRDATFCTPMPQSYTDQQPGQEYAGASRHPVFGKVTAGQDVVKKIETTPTQDDRPNTPVQVIKVTISGA